MRGSALEGRSHSPPKNERVFDWLTVILGAPAGHLEPPGRVQPARSRIRFPHLEEYFDNAALAELSEHSLHQRPPDTLALLRSSNAEVEDFSFVKRVMGDHIAQDRAAPLSDKKRHAGPDTLGQISLRPGIGEDGPLDRGDLRHVSEEGGTDLVRGVRAEPPI